MSEQTFIKPLNDEHAQAIGISLGLTAAINLLKSDSEIYSKLPGFNTAIALIEAVEAQHRATIAGSNIRAAVKAGFDITTHMVGLIGRGKIYVEPMDLEQLAEFGSEPSS